MTSQWWPGAPTESRTVARDGAERVAVELRMGSGELLIGGGASGLLEADFHYSIPSWRPELTYETRDGQGYLAIRQPDGAGRREDGRQRWTLRLADDLPLTLRIAVGAATIALTQGNLALTDLDLQTGAATLDLDLAGARAPYDATIKGGALTANLRLPGALGGLVGLSAPIVTIDADGLRRHGRDYANAAYDPTAPALRVRIAAGVATLTLATGAAAG